MIAETIQTDGRAATTGVYMRRMVDKYYRDMRPHGSLTLEKVFSLIKDIPFTPDPEFAETLQRPAYTMNQSGLGGDCDDKCIALASWCKLRGGSYNPNDFPARKYDYRFVAVRRADMPVLHHVFCEVYIMDRWIHADPTYKFNTLGREREQYAEYVII